MTGVSEPTATAVAIRHVPFEDLGILEGLLARRGYAIRYLDAGIEQVTESAIGDPELLVVLGGPIGVYEVVEYPFLADERKIIATRLRSHRPILGICLGAQLIAAALGAEVSATGRTEIGYGPLELTAAGRDSVLAALDGVRVLHWHGDQFAIPAGASRLAQTPGFPNQAFTLGDSVLGLQFHLEADHTQVERWLIGHAHELAAQQISPARLRADAAHYGPELERIGTVVLNDWLDRVDSAAGK